MSLLLHYYKYSLFNKSGCFDGCQQPGCEKPLLLYRKKVLHKNHIIIKLSSSRQKNKLRSGFSKDLFWQIFILCCHPVWVSFFADYYWKRSFCVWISLMCYKDMIYSNKILLDRLFDWFINKTIIIVRKIRLRIF